MPLWAVGTSMGTVSAANAFQGGTAVGDPCEAFAYHGDMGIDDDVVKAIADWIKATR